jgi:very-short-patch-repair endonuclease
VDQAVTAFAAARWGVFELSQARPLGLSADMASDRARAGRLHRLYIGVYSIVPAHLLKAEGRWLAAVLACGPGAVLSHLQAAALWDIRRMPAGPIHVSIPSRAGRRKRPGITTHRSSTLLPSHSAQQQLGPFTVDFLWPEARLVVEVDDFATHGRRETFESDRERDAWLQLQGYRVVRFTWRVLTGEPERVVATLKGLLEATRWAP